MDDDAPPITGNGISDDQWEVTYILNICSGSLSFIGSSAIVIKILRDKNWSSMPYERFIFALSCCDIASSITHAIDQFLFPRGTDDWEFGSEATCQIAGFLQHLTYPLANWYYGMLSYYFLLTVLSQQRQKNYVRKYEPWMHLSGLLIFPTIAIMGLRRGWYEESENHCRITDPKKLWIVAGLPTIFVYISLIINNIVVYSVVRRALNVPQHVTGPTLAQIRLKKEAVTSIFLYIGCFFITVTPPFVRQILEEYFGFEDGNNGDLYPLIILESICLPLQGFFNFFIYIKPVYTRFRVVHPNKSKCFVLQQAILKSKAPPLDHRRVANHITHGSDVLVTDITLMSNRGMNPNEALFYPGVCQLSSSRDSNIPQSHDPSNQSDTNNSNKEGQR